MADPGPPEQTLTEESSSSHGGAGAARPWLVYIGSTENAFAEAGRVFSLDAVRTVRFGRARDSLQAELSRGVLVLGVPLGWVSSAHAELRVVPSGDRFELDLRDLGSRNGTHVERAPISDRARLRPGEVFEIGRSFWMVREVAAPELEPARFEGLDATGTCNPQLVAIQRTLARLAPSDVPLLLCGETGTGKEISARAIHRTSGRRGRFVTANLAALSDDRVDSVLGGAPGAPGVFASATGGTLFFDELGELTPTVQAKLLAAVTESRASGQSPAAVRTICSSLHDVHAMVLRGSFRPDLYSRLVGFSATLPPLRERREDIGLIIRAVSLARTLPARLSTRAFRRLLGHDWPYNVRELEQTVATAAILAASGGEISREVIDEIVERRGDMPKNPESVHALRAQLVDGLARAGGDTTEMARAMARDPAEVQRWLERFELRPEAYRGPRVGGETLAERLGPAGDDE